jgi:hypothetical protein
LRGAEKSDLHLHQELGLDASTAVILAIAATAAQTINLILA